MSEFYTPEVVDSRNAPQGPKDDMDKPHGSTTTQPDGTGGSNLPKPDERPKPPPQK